MEILKLLADMCNCNQENKPYLKVVGNDKIWRCPKHGWVFISNNETISYDSSPVEKIKLNDKTRKLL